jgi:sugar-specific transcriptional regulator TrmB
MNIVFCCSSSYDNLPEVNMKDVTKKIEALGFSTYEAKVFWVLYQGFSMSAADVAKEAKIPRT